MNWWAVRARPSRVLWTVFSLCILLYVFAFYAKLQNAILTAVISGSSGHQPSETHQAPSNDTSFKAIALKHGLGKVIAHKYQDMYERHLRPLQGKPVKMLEIGLGCNMASGPGASYHAWLEFLPGVDMYSIDINEKCAEGFKKMTPNARIAIGDQADPSFLAQFSKESTGDGLFDVIIDNGGHFMEEQITSLDHLWKIVKPGGLYVIEDLRTSYSEEFFGDPSGRDTRKHTTTKYVYAVLDDLMAGWTKKPVSRAVASIDCMPEICVLSKKRE
ncbi:hypothetical protein FDECE_8947 [Fusarium decemcellulare]|nr:hypothetical protein FDECE_8947 [Fusarium decemcellulare]